MPITASPPPPARPSCSIVSIIATLLLAPFFPDAGHAAAWGVLVAGMIIVAVVGGDAEMHGIGIRLRMPRLDKPTRRFLKALGPAIIGAGGVQLALFADTLIASLSADRRAVGALLRRPHQPAPDRRGRHRRRHRAVCRRCRGGSRPATRRGRPRRRRAASSSRCSSPSLARRAPSSFPISSCARYSLAALSRRTTPPRLAPRSQPTPSGYLPFVLLRSFTAPFYARGDTATPVKAALLAASINILLKVLLMGHLAQVGTRARDQRRRLDQFEPARASSPADRASPYRGRRSAGRC